MAGAVDPYWQAAADHVTALGLAAEAVLAPTGFVSLLPGCRRPAEPPAADDLAALVLHKGRLEEAPAESLLAALDRLTVTFANAVFMVFTKSGAPLEPEHPHAMPREALLAAALRAHGRAPAASALARPARMPATYMGQGRVLLESAFGHLMLVDGSDTSIAPHLIRDGWFDRHLTDALPALIAPGMVCLDIGANFGTYALIAASLVGAAGRVIAVEPVPRIAALLGENLALNGFGERSAVVTCALGAQPGTAVMHEFATRQGGNTLQSHVAAAAVAAYGEQVTTRDVACRTLDDLVAEYAPERLDFVKIDVEGAEHQVLMGGRDTLIRLRPRLLLEWHTAFFAAGTSEARALHDFLTETLGYTLRRIEAAGTSRPIGFDELMALGHSDLLAEPAP